MTITKRIPVDVEKFHGYINSTDDCQKAIDTIGYTIYPQDVNGRTDFSNKEGRKEIVNQPMYHRWEWKKEESLKWSHFRDHFNALYEKYKPANEKERALLKSQLDQCITDCIAYEAEYGLLNRIAQSVHTPQAQFRTFNIKQDTITYNTPLRTITIHYEKEQPMSDLENEFIKKYIALHDRALQISERIKKLSHDIKSIHSRLPALWKQIPALKDEADKASNRIFFPPPKMKGGFSEAISVYIPTEEEQQQRVDVLNKHLNMFHEGIQSLWEDSKKAYKELRWSDDGLYDDEKGGYTDPLFKEVKNLYDRTFHDSSGSIETLSLDDDYQDFLGSWSKALDRDEAADDWAKFIKEQSLFGEVYKAFVGFLNELYGSKDEPEDSAGAVMDNSTPDETDDLRAETIKRYEADLKFNTTTYYDISDWHIIMDYYDSKYDGKKKAAAMEKAMAQHPQNASLLIRKAQEESAELRYQNALELLKKAEELGPNLHPNYYYTKANIYRQLQTPDLAIPLYKKLMEQKAKELSWWRRNSYDCVIEIYENKKNYEECIRLSRELIAEEPDNETVVSDLARFYCLANQLETAESLVKPFLEKHPQSPLCLKRLGHIYFKLKQYQKAIEYYDAAFAIDKEEYYDAIYHKGKALMELKKFNEAVVCYELCLLYFKAEKNYHVKAAQCYTKLNLPDLATSHYRRALALDPDCREAFEALQPVKMQS